MLPNAQSGSQGFGLGMFNAPQQNTSQNLFQPSHTNSMAPGFGAAFGSTNTNQFQSNKLSNSGTNVFGTQSQSTFGTMNTNHFSTQSTGFFGASGNKPSVSSNQTLFGGYGTTFGQQPQNTMGSMQQGGLFSNQINPPNTSAFGQQQQTNIFGGMSTTNQGIMGGNMGFNSTMNQLGAQSGNKCVFSLVSNTSSDVTCIRIIDKSDFVYGLLDGTVAIGSMTAQNLPIHQFKLPSGVLSLAVNTNKVIFVGTMSGLYAIQLGSQPIQIGAYTGPVFQVATLGKLIIHSEMVMEGTNPKRMTMSSKNSWSAQVTTGNTDQLPIAYKIKVGSYDNTYTSIQDITEAACSGRFFLMATSTPTNSTLNGLLLVPNINSDRPLTLYNIKPQNSVALTKVNVTEENHNTKLNQSIGNQRIVSGIIGCCYDRSASKAVIATNDRCVYIFDLANKKVEQKQLQYPILHMQYSDFHRTCLFTAGHEIAYYLFTGTNEWGKLPGTSHGEICSFDIDDEKIILAIGSVAVLFQTATSQGRVSVVIVNLPSTQTGVYGNTHRTFTNKNPTTII